MCVMYVWTMYTRANFQVNRFENGLHIVQKLRKCPYLKFVKFVFRPKCATQKDKNSTIELPINFCIARKLFVAKITALKFYLFSPGSLIFMS